MSQSCFIFGCKLRSNGPRWTARWVRPQDPLSHAKAPAPDDRSRPTVVGTLALVAVLAIMSGCGVSAPRNTVEDDKTLSGVKRLIDRVDKNDSVAASWESTAADADVARILRAERDSDGFRMAIAMLLGSKSVNAHRAAIYLTMKTRSPALAPLVLRQCSGTGDLRNALLRMLVAVYESPASLIRSNETYAKWILKHILIWNLFAERGRHINATAMLRMLIREETLGETKRKTAVSALRWGNQKMSDDDFLYTISHIDLGAVERAGLATGFWHLPKGKSILTEGAASVADPELRWACNGELFRFGWRKDVSTLRKAAMGVYQSRRRGVAATCAGAFLQTGLVSRALGGENAPVELTGLLAEVGGDKDRFMRQLVELLTNRRTSKETIQLLNAICDWYGTSSEGRPEKGPRPEKTSGDKSPPNLGS